MPGQKRNALDKAKLLATLVEIRKEHTTRSGLYSHMNGWFLDHRMDRKERRDVFKVFMEHHEAFQPTLSMAEMTDMWYLCEMHLPEQKPQGTHMYYYQVATAAVRSFLDGPQTAPVDRETLST